MDLSAFYVQNFLQLEKAILGIGRFDKSAPHLSGLLVTQIS